jgi:hypothetical protein
MRRFLCVLMTFMFPIGIWLGVLGYELQSIAFLLTGWAAMVTLAERD